MKQYLWNCLIWLDQGLNTLTGGDPDETFSSRTGKGARGDFGRLVQGPSIVLQFALNLVFWPFQGWGHCARSIEEDEGRNDLLISHE